MLRFFIRPVRVWVIRYCVTAVLDATTVRSARVLMFSTQAVWLKNNISTRYILFSSSEANAGVEKAKKVHMFCCVFPQ